MFAYVVRRLILIPITLFCIVLVNFVIINLAPGDPVTITDISMSGEAGRRQGKTESFGSDDRYLQFREYYGLTLPILFNTWPLISLKEVHTTLTQLLTHHWSPTDKEEIQVKQYDSLRIGMGDRARFVMPHLLAIMDDSKGQLDLKKIAMRYFVRGGTRQAYLGPDLSEEKKKTNRKIAFDNNFLLDQMPNSEDNQENTDTKIQNLRKWYEENWETLNFVPTTWQKVGIFFFETRFFRYISRVCTLDFGTLRDDTNKTVLSEVTRRFKYSLTLAILPMIITFVLCQLLGFVMALKQNQWEDRLVNLICLILYAIPVFVVAPFLIEKVALNGYFPFTQIPIPISGFTSPDSVYDQMTSTQRLFDVMEHIALPILAVIYGTLAAQSRLARTAILEVLRQDYVRTAKAKGLPRLRIWFRHVGRNSAITIVTSIASSLGIILGGSLIVETLFEINGFGKFFYDAVVNRDYNVIMFSALAGSFLTLVGFLLADIAYTLLDPRVTLE